MRFVSLTYKSGFSSPTSPQYSMVRASYLEHGGSWDQIPCEAQIFFCVLFSWFLISPFLNEKLHTNNFRNIFNFSENSSLRLCWIYWNIYIRSWLSQCIFYFVSNAIPFDVVVVVVFLLCDWVKHESWSTFYPIRRKVNLELVLIFNWCAGLAATIVAIVTFLLFLLYYKTRLRATLPLQFFLLFSTDRDECSVKGSCPLANSYCVNTFGSFKCLCNKGYKEVYDAKKKLLKCQGMVSIVAVTALH